MMGYHPLIDSALVVLFAIIIIGFTPASSRLRTFSLPLLGFLAWNCISKCPLYIARSSWASSVGGYTLTSFLHFVDVAVLSQ
ncbi:hypothetical protein F4821DRAFT_235842 [Hypoxylon rubiginosum]|uniref:Uncharacterized protein n=1 Tax=Hypoxylon rubiginosum TaxID=110542 RepID=A0ACC0D417_9PEZI|nr:hypothetical protein F4821DRAFT_235842 [Hypoxylon rubiginosum]